MSDWDDILSETDKVLMDQEFLCHRFKQYWQALWMVLTTNRGDYEDAPLWRRLGIKVECIVAMLMLRSGISDRDYPKLDPMRLNPKSWFMSDDMGHFNSETFYGGWSCDVLKFNRAQFRYEIDSDGDSSL